MSSQENNPPAQQKVLIKDVQITNDGVAINLMAFMLEVAHRRGAFTLEEASKIHECIKQLEKKPVPPPPATQPVSVDDEQAKALFDENNVQLQVTETN